MSSTSRREDLWSSHAPLLKRLYQDERKTLREVKRIMESEHNFPEWPSSTYEVRLKALGMMKRLKKGYWVSIHHFARLRGYESYDVIINGTRKPWRDVWKEIRRSGALQDTSAKDAAVDLQLPHGVVLDPHRGNQQPRVSTSFEESSSNNPSTKASSPCDPSTANGKSYRIIVGALAIAKFVLSGQISDLNGDEQLQIDLLTNALANLPWMEFSNFVTTLESSGISPELQQFIATDTATSLLPSPTTSMDWDRASDTIFPGLWDLLAPHIRCQSSTNSIYEQLEAVVYVSSNGLLDKQHTVTLFAYFSTLTQRMNPSHIKALFVFASVSFRAAIATFVRDLDDERISKSTYTQRLSLAAFARLLHANTYNESPDLTQHQIRWKETLWDSYSRSSLCVLAASIGDSSLLGDVLRMKISARPIRSPFDVLGTAIGSRALGCVKVLLEYSENYPFGDIPLSHTSLSSMHDYLFLGQRFQTQFTDHGSALPLRVSTSDCLDELILYYVTYPHWAPQLCDIVCYMDTRFGPLLAGSIIVFRDQSLTRRIVCEHALQGLHALQFLLSGLSFEEKEPFLRMVLLELLTYGFHMRDGNGARTPLACTATILELLDEFVGPPLEHSESIHIQLLRVFCFSTKLSGLITDATSLLSYMKPRHHPHDIEELKKTLFVGNFQSLSVLVEYQILPEHFFDRYGTDFAIRAASSGDVESVEAVSRLSASDAGSSIRFRLQEDLSLYTQPLRYFLDDSHVFDERICNSLLQIGSEQGGVHLNSTLDIFELLEEVIEVYKISPSTEQAQFVLQSGLFDACSHALKHSSSAQWDRLFSVVVHHILNGYYARESELLIGHFLLVDGLHHRYYRGATATSLTRAILLGYPHEYLQSLFDSGADVNESFHGLTPMRAAIISQDLKMVHNLLQRGARVNDLVEGEGEMGGSLLYSACALPVRDINSRGIKSRLVSSLISQGAAIDGTSVRQRNSRHFLEGCVGEWGVPLHICASMGDIESAVLLLQHGADPNCSDSPIDWIDHEPLEFAVGKHRIDMAKLLLQAGAFCTRSCGTFRKILDGIDESFVSEVIRSHLAK